MVEIYFLEQFSALAKYETLAAAELAEKVLRENENVRDFDRKNRTISIGSCAPVPMNKLIWLLTEIFPSVAISSEMNSDEYLLRGLKEDLFQLIILHEKPIDENLFAKKIGSEKLYLVLPPNHKFADKKGIFLEELNGEKILLYSKSGCWYELCKKKSTVRKIFNADRARNFYPNCIFAGVSVFHDGYFFAQRDSSKKLRLQADFGFGGKRNLLLHVQKK